MAKTNEMPAYEPERMYRVQLKRAIEVTPGNWLAPGKVNTLKGKVAEKHADAIADAQPA